MQLSTGCSLYGKVFTSRYPVSALYSQNSTFLCTNELWVTESIQKVDLDFICNNDNYQTIENLFEESIVRFSKLAKCDTCKDSASPFHEGGSPYKEITGLVISEKNIRVR